jgi:putative heme transporter
MTAPAAAPAERDGDTGDAEPPGGRSRRSLGWTVALMVAMAALLYAALTQVAGLHDTWRRLASGDPLWLCAAALLEVASYAAYVFTFHRLFARPGSRIGWRESYDIALAGVVASRVFATAGAGGIALTVWALDRSGMPRALLVRRLTTFYVLLYGLLMAALVVVGTALRTGLLNGPAPFGLTVVPAVFGGVAILAALAAARLPPDLGARAADRLSGHERAAKWVGRAAGWVATLADGVRGAVDLVRARDIVVLGAFLWWAFDIGVLWACLEAFGEPPAGGVVVMGYLAGTLGNVLPLPGGLGGVEGAMIGALLGFHVHAALAVTAVLGYRAFEYWLPIIPGALAYVHLLRTVRAWSEEPEPESHKACDDGSPRPTPS